MFNFCNKQAFGQNFINTTLSNFLYLFTKTYFENIFMYDKMLQNQCLQVCNILKSLWKDRIQVKNDRSQFYI